MHTPPVEAHLRDQLLPVARQRLPEKTTADWCSELIVTGDMKEAVKKHNYWWEDLPYVRRAFWSTCPTEPIGPT